MCCRAMVRPPLERPIPAASSRPFCEVASAWVLQMVASTSTYPKPGSVLSALKKTRPNARNRPVPKPGRPRAPVARFRRQIAPRTGPTCPPQDRAEEQSIVRTGPPVITLLARNQRRDDGALPVGQDPPAQDRRPFSILNQTEDDLGIS